MRLIKLRGATLFFAAGNTTALPSFLRVQERTMLGCTRA
jgi:hypothetical protein